jgi:hypothetical protein
VNPGGPMAFDAKSNPFQFLPSGMAAGASVDSLQDQSNQLVVANNAAISQQQLSQLQQEFYHQQLRGMAGLHSGASMIPMQNAAAQQLKQGSISGGYPIQRPVVNVSQAPMNGVVNAPPTQTRNFQQRFLY